MNEVVIERERRFVTIKEFCKQTGLSYQTVDHLCKTGQLRFITTEGGLRRIDTQQDGSMSQDVLQRLDKLERMLLSVCRLFNVSQCL